MKYSIPEKMGIKSSWIKEYIEVLENASLSTHDVIIMRHDNIVFEKYWEPFSKDFLHRMYSVTKSFVSLAIGFLEQEGKINLDDPIIKYFPDELKNQSDENIKNQTIRHMLMMSTAMTAKNWFNARIPDRVKYYFENDDISRSSGTVFDYDSTGSFVLGALVERITKKPFMDYLREKCLDKIGFSKEAYMLKCPEGHSWSDSALLCTAEDLLRAAMFCMHKGNWNGEQLLNEDYVTAATSKQIDNNFLGINLCDTQGYGYKFWMTYDNSFFFNGMGCQFAVCVPDKDMILIYNGDNQGNVNAPEIIIGSFFDKVVRKVQETELLVNGEYDELNKYTEGLKLFAAKGERKADICEKINGKTFKMDKNPMGITKIKFTFDDNGGVFHYTNAQGDKEIPFGMCENVFSEFPQEGYSDEIGSQKSNKLYKCAVSAAWVSDYQLFIKVQIIDTYFGILNINAGFNDNKIGVYMNKSAEDFLDEYVGFAGGECEK